MKFIKLFIAVIALCFYAPVYGAINNPTPVCGGGDVVTITADNMHCCVKAPVGDVNGGTDCYEYSVHHVTGGNSGSGITVCNSRPCPNGVLSYNFVTVCEHSSFPSLVYSASEAVCTAGLGCLSGQYLIGSGICAQCPDGWAGSDNDRDSINDCYKNCAPSTDNDGTGSWFIPLTKVYWSGLVQI